MKNNQPVTQRELDYRESQRIVSATNTKGVLTYANQDFIDISGFSVDELMGQSHNIVRHPDMPQAAFKDLWESLKAGKSWMGVVKNRCKNGDHYWVDAFVTAIKEGNQTTGYQSVRLKPSRQLIAQAERVYRELSGRGSGLTTLLKRLRFKLAGQVWLSQWLAIAVLVLVFQLVGASLSAVAAWSLSAGVALAVGFAAAKWLAAPWAATAESSKAIIDDDVAQQVYSGRIDELGQLQLALKMLKSQQEAVVWRIGDTAELLQHTAQVAETISNTTASHMHRQAAEMDMVATAMNEMSSTIQEVAANASHTATSTRQAEEEVRHGYQVVDNTINHINQLAQSVSGAEQAIDSLTKGSEEIGSVVEVIRGIAEQTNLLALNAAIEAARAGEQGRGFAVVADEVRALASRTQVSTNEIQEMIERLQAAASEAKAVMDHGKKIASDSVGQASEAGKSLKSIRKAVDTITSMTTQIATAAEQQSSVSDEINRSIVNVHDLCKETLAASSQAKQANADLSEQTERLNKIVQQFGQL